MARTGKDQDTDLRNAYGTVSDVLGRALRETVQRHDPQPARTVVRQIVAIDSRQNGNEPPPGWSLAYLVLAGWFDAARTELADRPDRADRALDWVEEHLGRRQRLRARYTIGPLTSVSDAQETSHYVEALGDDFLASMIWALAAVTDLYPSADGDPDWLRTKADAAL